MSRRNKSHSKNGAVKWSPSVGDYATGRITAAQIRCVLCRTAPCSCRTNTKRGAK